MGGVIVDVGETIWLEMFKHIHAFIVERAGEVY